MCSVLPIPGRYASYVPARIGWSPNPRWLSTPWAWACSLCASHPLRPPLSLHVQVGWAKEMDRKEWRPTCISAVSTQLTKCCGIGELPNPLHAPPFVDRVGGLCWPFVLTRGGGCRTGSDACPPPFSLDPFVAGVAACDGLLPQRRCLHDWLVWVALHTPRHSHRSALERLFFPLFGQPPSS